MEPREVYACDSKQRSAESNDVSDQSRQQGPENAFPPFLLRIAHRLATGTGYQDRSTTISAQQGTHASDRESVQDTACCASEGCATERVELNNDHTERPVGMYTGVELLLLRNVTFDASSTPP